jgi:hypothetical protein
MAEPIQSTVAGVSLITLAVAVFGPNAGPYIVIVLGSLGGGLWALSSAVIETRVQGAWLMLRCLVTAIVLTAMVAGLLGPWLGVDTVEVYVVVAFVIGALGNKWLEIIDAIKTRVQNMIIGGARP